MKYRNRRKVKFSKAPSETSSKYFLPKHLSNLEFLFPGMAVSSAFLNTIRMGVLEYFSYPLVAGLEIFEVLPQLNHSPRQSAKHHLQSLHLKQ